MTQAVILQPITLKMARSDCQTLAIARLTPEISPASLATLAIPTDLNPQRGVLLYNKAPTWLYGHLADRLREFAWVACFDVRSNAAIVISSRIADLEPGDTFPVTVRETPGVALLIAGPPNSGKSVLANTLRMALDQHHPDCSHYLFRANWDGEGNHTFETPDRAIADRLRTENKRKLQHQPEADTLIEKFFSDRAQELANIRQVVDLTLVDVGGKPDPVKLPVIDQCTHYWIISNDAAKVDLWHDLCKAKLTPLSGYSECFSRSFRRASDGAVSGITCRPLAAGKNTRTSRGFTTAVVVVVGSKRQSKFAVQWCLNNLPQKISSGVR
ncbi:CRISPR-associated protein Csx3 [Trichothermofontia sp.]